MRRYLLRYWGTVVGSCLIGGTIALGVGLVGAGSIDDLVNNAMAQRAEHFSRILTTVPEGAETLLTGLSRDADKESQLRSFAGLERIEAFAVYAPDGSESFSSKSDRHSWLLRDRAGGMTSKNRLSPSVLAMRPPFQHVQAMTSDSYVVVAPMVRDGRLLGYVSITTDPRPERSAYARSLSFAALKILGIILLAAGLPLLIFLRRKNKIAEAADRIEFLANHDPLTQLLNRRRLQEEAERVVTTARITREELAYLCIDIDGLSEINDTLGQAAGDELLRVVASRLSATVASGQLLARIAGDDFVIVTRLPVGGEGIASFARRLREAVREPVELKGRIVRPEICIGVAQLPRDGRTQNELVKHAELALLRHKAVPTDDYVSFDPSMDEETDRRRQVEALVRQAVENQSFELTYQPLVSGNGRLLVGFEALLRMRDEKGNYVPPSVFVPIAESRGYIKRIGTWVIQEAARQAALWPQELTVSVNLSAVQFQDGDLVEIVREALRDAGISGRRIEVEVVESLILQRTESVISQLRELKALGVSIAMDDFGTGYSSLGYLWKFPFDKLKIDRSFMIAFDDGEANVPVILDTIISLAHVMGMTVTTEGVETKEQAEMLELLGCDIQQGFYFGKPTRPDDVPSEVLGRFALRRTADAPAAPLRKSLTA